MVNLCQFIDPACDSYTHMSLVLCQKYSLHSLKDEVKFATTPCLKVQMIKQSDEYKSKKNYFKVICGYYFHYLDQTLALKNQEIKTHQSNFKYLVTKKPMIHSVRTNLLKVLHIIVKHQNHATNKMSVTFV